MSIPEPKTRPAGMKIPRDVFDRCEKKRQQILKDKKHPLWPVCTTPQSWYSYLIMKTLEEID